jgi:hypothetical protein
MAKRPELLRIISVAILAGLSIEDWRILRRMIIAAIQVGHRPALEELRSIVTAANECRLAWNKGDDDRIVEAGDALRVAYCKMA